MAAVGIKIPMKQRIPSQMLKLKRRMKQDRPPTRSMGLIQMDWEPMFPMWTRTM